MMLIHSFSVVSRFTQRRGVFAVLLRAKITFLSFAVELPAAILHSPHSGMCLSTHTSFLYVNTEARFGPVRATSSGPIGHLHSKADSVFQSIFTSENVTSDVSGSVLVHRLGSGIKVFWVYLLLRGPRHCL